MEYILFTMIMLIVIVAVLANRLTNNNYPFPFERKHTVFTPAEKNFQNLLELAVGLNYRVINRVCLIDMITIRRGVSKKARQTATIQAKNKYLDFVICDKNSMELLGVIDLVDTQGKGYKVKKDWFVSGALDAAGIPHIRIKIKPNYSLDEIRACVNSKLLGYKAPEPSYRGVKIPAPLVKARPKPKFAGAMAKSAMPSTNPELAQNKQIPAPKLAALPH
jgi:hypothetical protein